MRLLNSVPGDQITARRPRLGDHGADANVPIGARHALGRAPGSEVGNRHALLARQARHDRAEGGLEHVAHLLLRQFAGVRGHVAGQVCDPV